MAYYQGARRKVFLLTYSGLLFQKFLTDFLDTRPEALHWFGILPSTILIISRSDAVTLANLIHAQFPHVRFVITEVDPRKTSGWINQQVWDFINNPQSSGRWEPPG